MKKKIFAGVLALSMFLVPTARADELTDPYIDRIGVDIMPPQYADNSVSGPNPSDDEWKESVKSQGEIRRVDGAVKWERDQKEFKIKKENQNGKSVEGVTFTAYNTKEDAENNRNPIGKATSGEGGYVDFKNVPLYYEFYIKETSVPEGYDISKEIIPVYRDNGVRFLGEMKVTELNDNIKGGTEKNNLTTKETKNLNTYLQGLVSGGTRFNSNTNWLVYNDNGTEKLVSKKPLKHSVSWNSLYNAGVVFGEDGVKDLINADSTNSNYEVNSWPQPPLKDYGKGKGTPKTYEPQYVNMNGKTYIVRLMRAYSDDVPINREGRTNNFGAYDKTKGSEWNRLILPLIGPTEDDDSTGYNNGINGRYGRITKSFVEANMPTLANYSWWKDFGGNTLKQSNNNRWAQDLGYDGYSGRYEGSRAHRGNSISDNGAAHSGSSGPDLGNNNWSWLAVLERVS